MSVFREHIIHDIHKVLAEYPTIVARETLTLNHCRYFGSYSVYHALMSRDSTTKKTVYTSENVQELMFDEASFRFVDGETRKSLNQLRLLVNMYRHAEVHYQLEPTIRELRCHYLMADRVARMGYWNESLEQYRYCQTHSKWAELSPLNRAEVEIQFADLLVRMSKTEGVSALLDSAAVVLGGLDETTEVLCLKLSEMRTRACLNILIGDVATARVLLERAIDIVQDNNEDNWMLDDMDVSLELTLDEIDPHREDRLGTLYSIWLYLSTSQGPLPFSDYVNLFEVEMRIARALESEDPNRALKYCEFAEKTALFLCERSPEIWVPRHALARIVKFQIMLELKLEPQLSELLESIDILREVVVNGNVEWANDLARGLEIAASYSSNEDAIDFLFEALENESNESSRLEILRELAHRVEDQNELEWAYQLRSHVIQLEPNTEDVVWSLLRRAKVSIKRDELIGALTDCLEALFLCWDAELNYPNVVWCRSYLDTGLVHNALGLNADGCSYWNELVLAADKFLLPVDDYVSRMVSIARENIASYSKESLVINSPATVDETVGIQIIPGGYNLENSKLEQPHVILLETPEGYLRWGECLCENCISSLLIPEISYFSFRTFIEVMGWEKIHFNVHPTLLQSIDNNKEDDWGSHIRSFVESLSEAGVLCTFS